MWDVGNMIWDAGKIVTGAVTGNTALMTEGAIDLALDTAAAVVPGVPAGASKAARAAKAAQKATKRRKNTKAVKKKKHKGQKEVNPGDCTKARHRKLQNRVDFHKKQPGCKGDMSCSELKRNYQYKRKLVSARTIINNVCFRGGDDIHIKALKEAQRAVKNCVKFIRKKCKCK